MISVRVMEIEMEISDGGKMRGKVVLVRRLHLQLLLKPKKNVNTRWFLVAVPSMCGSCGCVSSRLRCVP